MALTTTAFYPKAIGLSLVSEIIEMGFFILANGRTTAEMGGESTNTNKMATNTQGIGRRIRGMGTANKLLRRLSMKAIFSTTRSKGLDQSFKTEFVLILRGKMIKRMVKGKGLMKTENPKSTFLMESNRLSREEQTQGVMWRVKKEM